VPASPRKEDDLRQYSNNLDLEPF
jgi:hypothetical protein